MTGLVRVFPCEALGLTILGLAENAPGIWILETTVPELCRPHVERWVCHTWSSMADARSAACDRNTRTRSPRPMDSQSVGRSPRNLCKREDTDPQTGVPAKRAGTRSARTTTSGELRLQFCLQSEEASRTSDPRRPRPEGGLPPPPARGAGPPARSGPWAAFARYQDRSCVQRWHSVFLSRTKRRIRAGSRQCATFFDYPRRHEPETEPDEQRNDQYIVEVAD